MTNPRELLDTYADEVNFDRGDLSDDRDFMAPKAFDALRAVLDLHPDESHECPDNDGTVYTTFENECPTRRAITKSLKWSES